LLLAISQLSPLNLVGCGSRKSYPGPEIDSSQLSRVSFRARNVLISNQRIDNQPLGLLTPSVETKAGSRTAQADFELRDTECPYFLPGCVDVHYHGECEVSFRSEPGVDYIVEIEGIAKSAFITAKQRTAEGAVQTAAVGICRVTKRSSDDSRQAKGLPTF
jgi:hypothetical protein